VVIFLLDAAAGIRQSDDEISPSLWAASLLVIVAPNKTDPVRRRELLAVLEDARRKPSIEPIPICARAGAGMADRLIPVIVESYP
jgi:predicted GTPase